MLQFDDGIGADDKRIGKHFGSRVRFEFRIGNGNRPEIDSLLQLLPPARKPGTGCGTIPAARVCAAILMPI